MDNIYWVQNYILYFDGLEFSIITYANIFWEF